MLLWPPFSIRVWSCYSFIILCAIGTIHHFVYHHRHIMSHAKEAQYTEIPRIIWYKLGSNGLSEHAKIWTDSCIKNNPTYKAHFMTDESGDKYVRESFAFRPDIVNSYLAMQVPIYKADLLRYLLLWDQGGVWSDLDVSCEDRTIDEWVPVQYRKDAAIVVGWEFDQGWPGEYFRQFASWTLMAKPQSPHLMQVIEDILEKLQEVTARHHISIQNATLDIMGDVVDFTGPRRLTRSILRSLEKQLGRPIDTAELKELVQPKLVGDVLVMPGYSFAASSNKYTPEQEELLPPKLVEHHYAGSWKNSKGGE